MVIGLILSKPLLLVGASPLLPLVSSSFYFCPIVLAVVSVCSVLPNRWFTPHFAVYAEFASSFWDAVVERARIHSPLWFACWLDC